MKVYRANRTFHYVDDKGEFRLVTEGQIVEGASDGLIASLLDDGMIREGRTSQKRED